MALGNEVVGLTPEQTMAMLTNTRQAKAEPTDVAYKQALARAALEHINLGRAELGERARATDIQAATTRRGQDIQNALGQAGLAIDQQKVNLQQQLQILATIPGAQAQIKEVEAKLWKLDYDRGLAQQIKGTPESKAEDLKIILQLDPDAGKQYVHALWGGEHGQKVQWAKFVADNYFSGDVNKAVSYMLNENEQTIAKDLTKAMMQGIGYIGKPEQAAMDALKIARALKETVQGPAPGTTAVSPPAQTRGPLPVGSAYVRTEGGKAVFRAPDGKEYFSDGTPVRR